MLPVVFCVRVCVLSCLTLSLLSYFQVWVCVFIGEFMKWTIKLPQSKIQFSLGQAIRKVLFWFCSACSAIRCICSENCHFVAFSPSVLALMPQTVPKQLTSLWAEMMHLKSLCSGKIDYHQYWWLIFLNYKGLNHRIHFCSIRPMQTFPRDHHQA